MHLNAATDFNDDRKFNIKQAQILLFLKKRKEKN